MQDMRNEVNSGSDVMGVAAEAWGHQRGGSRPNWVYCARLVREGRKECETPGL